MACLAFRLHPSTGHFACKFVSVGDLFMITKKESQAGNSLNGKKKTTRFREWSAQLGVLAIIV